MEISKDLLNKIIKHIKSWYTALILTVFFGIYPFLTSYYNKKPLYSVSQEYTIANNDKLNNSFHFYLGKKELSNIKQTTLTVWNDGNSYIDFSDFSDVSPITFSHSKKNQVDIHKVEIFEKSRSNIKIESKIIVIDSIEQIQFKFIGDDALEQNDGFKALITYSSNNTTSWELNGRVKGAENKLGFENFQISKTPKNNLTNIISFSLLLIVIVRVIICIYKKKTIIFKNWEVVFTICYLLYVYLLPLLLKNNRIFEWVIVS
jgi:hypothetical protein